MALMKVRTPHYIPHGLREGRVNVYDRRQQHPGQAGVRGGVVGAAANDDDVGTTKDNNNINENKNVKSNNNNQRSTNNKITSAGFSQSAANAARNTVNDKSRNAIRRRGDERLAAQEHHPAFGNLLDLLNDSSDDGGDTFTGGAVGVGRLPAGVSYRVSPATSPHDVSSPWQLSALALLFAVVMLSALFLHIISDAQKSSMHHNHHHTRNPHRSSRQQKTPRKKKTDEWSDDNTDDDVHHQHNSNIIHNNNTNLKESLLLNDSVRSHSQSVDADDIPHPIKAAPVYYPYHPPGHHQTGLQQHRHRKMSAAAQQQTQQPSAQPSQAPVVVPQAQPVAAQPPAVGQTAFQQRNYYLNTSGGAVVAPSFPKATTSATGSGQRSTACGTGAAATPSPAVTPRNTSSLLAVPMGTPLLPHLRQQASQSQGQQLESSQHQPLQQQQQPQPRVTSLYPQILSSVSSFDSSVEHTYSEDKTERGSGARRRQQDHRRQSSSDDISVDSSSAMGLVTPVVSKSVSRLRTSSAVQSPKVVGGAGAGSPSFQQSTSSRLQIPSSMHTSQHQQPPLLLQRQSSHLLLSPGGPTSANSPRSRGSRASRRSDFVEETPRANNLRSTKIMPLGQQHQHQQHQSLIMPPPAFPKPHGTPDGYDSETFKFASPPLQPRIPEHDNVNNADGIDMDTEVPFIPSLEVRAVPPDVVTPQPASVNLDDLHLYQMMESGNISHWQARIEEESRQLQSQALQGLEKATSSSSSSSSSSPPSSSDGFIAGFMDSNSEIPSNDPRGSIRHKRDNLTDDSDSAASLQGAIAFNELRLVEVIGGGGFGQVWKAMWRGTPVAVKVLTGSAQSKHVPKAVLEEFVAEINLLKGMRHPNICLYMGACLQPPNRAIITELAANGSLWDALRLPLMAPYVCCDGVTREGWPLSMYSPDARHGAPPVLNASGVNSGPMTPSSGRVMPPIPPRGTWHWLLVKRVAIGAARGMAYLHSGKPPVLHRDLKSANILLDDSYAAKVCDFGLSRLKAQGRSMTGNCGTVQWMAPEVLASMCYNEKADIYSYGIICWELLTRQCPFDGMTAIQCALAVLNRNSRPEIPKWCPPALHALIRSCVKKDPSERPTFEQVLQALEQMP